MGIAPSSVGGNTGVAGVLEVPEIRPIRPYYGYGNWICENKSGNFRLAVSGGEGVRRFARRAIPATGGRGIANCDPKREAAPQTISAARRCFRRAGTTEGDVLGGYSEDNLQGPR